MSSHLPTVHSLSLLRNIPFVDTSYLLIQSQVEEHLGRFWFLAITSKVAKTNYVQPFERRLIFIPLE